jgi:hypothetical protein
LTRSRRRFARVERASPIAGPFVLAAMVVTSVDDVELVVRPAL